MIPVVTPDEMKAIDAAAAEPVDVLIGRAGAAVARVALDMLGGAYGRRVVVIAGKGNNGADGRDAAARLRKRGVLVHVADAADALRAVPACDLVIDAAYGTGFRGEYDAPDPGPAPVLAVDIPSGVNGLTGEAAAGAVQADVTVTFAALKPGLLLLPGAARAGRIELVDIGLDVSGATIHLVEESDVCRWLPARPPESHKWRAAAWVVAGSPGMTGAARLSARAAMHAGAGMVRLGVPGVDQPDPPLEVVGVPLPSSGWETTVLGDLNRFRALLVGPGLGRTEATAAAVREIVARAPVPVIVDADGLVALGEISSAARVIAGRTHSTVLTPHDGEFAGLAGGNASGPDRIGAVRKLARATGATVLLKGPATVVAAPDGRVLLSNEGDARLASAGTGDVLSGVVAGFLAQGLDGLTAAGAAAFVHAAAGNLGWRRGLVAGDLLDLLPAVLSRLDDHELSEETNATDDARSRSDDD
jgi:NAD(P)H-hydrate epimerase